MIEVQVSKRKPSIVDHLLGAEEQGVMEAVVPRNPDSHFRQAYRERMGREAPETLVGVGYKSGADSRTYLLTMRGEDVAVCGETEDGTLIARTIVRGKISRLMI